VRTLNWEEKKKEDRKSISSGAGKILAGGPMKSSEGCAEEKENKWTEEERNLANEGKA